MMKTGGTTIKNALKNYYGAVDLSNEGKGMHTSVSRLNDFRLKKNRVVASIRNPFSWYISLYHHIERKDHAINQLNSDSSFKESFDSFLRYCFQEDRVLGEIPFNIAKHYDIGPFTAHFLEMFCKEGWKKRDKDNLKLDEVLDEFCQIDDFIYLENLNDGFFSLLFDLDKDISKLDQLPEGNTYSVDGYDFSEYYNDYLRSLIEEKDEFLLDYFSYPFDLEDSFDLKLKSFESDNQNSKNNFVMNNPKQTFDNKTSSTCLFSLATDIDRHRREAEYSIPAFSEYCEKHGYDYYIFKDSDKVKDIDPFFNKENLLNLIDEWRLFDTLYSFPVIEKLLDMGYENVFMIDAFDCIITDLETELESFVDEGHSLFFSATPGFCTKDEKKSRVRRRAINTGFCGFRNTDFTYEFIDDCRKVNFGDLPGNSEQFVMGETIKGEKYENQVAIGDPLQQKFWYNIDPNFSGTICPPWKASERLDIWRYGDFMVHFHTSPQCENPRFLRLFYEEFYK